MTSTRPLLATAASNYKLTTIPENTKEKIEQAAESLISFNEKDKRLSLAASAKSKVLSMIKNLKPGDGASNEAPQGKFNTTDAYLNMMRNLKKIKKTGEEDNLRERIDLGKKMIVDYAADLLPTRFPSITKKIVEKIFKP